MKRLKFAALALGVLMLAASTASAEVQLSIRDGRVTLVAKDATVRQILTEWARVGQTKIVNVERIAGAPITLQLTSVPEAEALDILLRSVSGYLAAPRPAAVPTLSRYDRIVVMATAPIPRALSAAAAPAASVFQPPAEIQDAARPGDDDPSRAPAADVVVPASRGPIFQTFPAPQILNPQGASGQAPSLPPADQAPSVAPFPGATMSGVPRPGMVIQPPATQPGQAQPVQIQPTPARVGQ